MVLDARQCMRKVKGKGLEEMWEGRRDETKRLPWQLLTHYGNCVTSPLSLSIDLSICFWLCNNFSTKSGLQYIRCCPLLASSTDTSTYTRRSGTTKSGLPPVPELLLYSFLHTFAKNWPECLILLMVKTFWVITESWVWFIVACVLHCLGVEQLCAAEKCWQKAAPTGSERGRERSFSS